MLQDATFSGAAKFQVSNPEVRQPSAARCPFHAGMDAAKGLLTHAKALFKFQVQSQIKSQSRALTRDAVESAMGKLLSQKNYPCIAALKSFHKKDYEIGTYGRFGTGESWRKLRADLLKFVEHQKTTNSIYLTYFAAFEPEEFSEPDFEKSLWQELSCLTSIEERQSDWADLQNANPGDQNFRFSLGGTEFFVVGLHTQSSRLARRFPFPVLIFNVFDQFEQLERQGIYESMVKTNRERDIKFQGQVNPMVEAYGDQWEPIQFSGKENSPAWRCPFHFMHQSMKPDPERHASECP